MEATQSGSRGQHAQSRVTLVQDLVHVTAQTPSLSSAEVIVVNPPLRVKTAVLTRVQVCTYPLHPLYFYLCTILNNVIALPTKLRWPYRDTVYYRCYDVAVVPNHSRFT